MSGEYNRFRSQESNSALGRPTSQVWAFTFFGQIELLKLGPLLVELHLQLLLKLEDVSPLLLQISHPLLKNPCEDTQQHYKHNEEPSKY